MAYQEILTRQTVTIEADGAGAFVAGNVERHFAVTVDGQSRPPVTTRDVIQAETLSVLLPQAALMAQVAALTAERDAAVASRDAAVARVDQLEAELGHVDAEGVPVLSAVQVRLGLLGAGITPAQVEGIIAQIGDDAQRITAQTYWEYATQIHRSHPLIATLGSALGLTSAQIDQMWAAAAGIQ
jgi:hypothetical protein